MAISRYVEVNGLRLHYLDYGGVGLKPLVCIHGLTGNAHNFDPVAPNFVAKYHVISLDVRGRGDSQWGPPQNYNYATYVSDLAAFLDLLNFDRVSLLGTSMGGIISMIYAGDFPDRVERLALNDIGPELNPVGLARIVDYVSHAPLEFGSFAEVIEYYRRTYPPAAGVSEERLAEFSRWAVRETENGRFTWKMDPEVRKLRAAQADSSLATLWDSYRRIKAPVLVLRGAESDLLSAETVRKMCEAHPNTEVVELPGVGHAPFLTEPQALSALRKFFGC